MDRSRSDKGCWLLNERDVLDEVERIKEIAGDDEMAHSAEDELHQDVLKFIALGQDENGKLAQAALKTKEIEFSRWCA